MCTTSTVRQIPPSSRGRLIGRCSSRQWTTARTAERAVAKRQHDELAARLWKEKQSGRQLSDALVAWLKAKPRGRSEVNAVRQIRAGYKDRPLVDVTEAGLIEAFGAKSAGTYNKLVVIVRAALNMAHRAGWIEAAPHIRRRKEPPGVDRFLTAEQWKTLRAELPEHLQRMADFGLATGLRWSNIAGLTWDRVSLTHKLAWVEAQNAKGRRSIAIPLSRTAVTTLRRVPGAREGYVFTYAGKRIGSAKTAWRKAVERAGLAGLRWHDLRHTWASWHAMAGTPQEVLQRLGAWRTPTMVQRYAHLTPSHLAGFADNAKPVTLAGSATKMDTTRAA